jgi:hypothetical protein
MPCNRLLSGVFVVAWLYVFFPVAWVDLVLLIFAVGWENAKKQRMSRNMVRNFFKEYEEK